MKKVIILNYHNITLNKSKDNLYSITPETFKEHLILIQSLKIPIIKLENILEHNINANSKTYKQRQAIVIHPYGIIKRQWGFNYIMTKRSIKRASADVGLIFTAFNLRRLMNIINKKIF